MVRWLQLQSAMTASTTRLIAALSLAAFATTAGLGSAAANDLHDPAPKDGTTATLLAIGGTAAGFGLIALGGQSDTEGLALLGVGVMAVGPSAGHFYAGETGHGLVTSGIRAGGMVATAVGFSMSFCLFDCEARDQTERHNGELLMLTGLGVYAATTLYDLVDAHQAVARVNKRHIEAATAALITTPDGHRAPALVVAGTF